MIAEDPDSEHIMKSYSMHIHAKPQPFRLFGSHQLADVNRPIASTFFSPSCQYILASVLPAPATLLKMLHMELWYTPVPKNSWRSGPGFHDWCISLARISRTMRWVRPNARKRKKEGRGSRELGSPARTLATKVTVTGDYRAPRCLGAIPRCGLPSVDSIAPTTLAIVSFTLGFSFLCCNFRCLNCRALVFFFYSGVPNGLLIAYLRKMSMPLFSSDTLHICSG